MFDLPANVQYTGRLIADILLDTVPFQYRSYLPLN